MLEPKFLVYLTDKKAKTKYGYEYNKLKDNTPEELKKEYMAMLDMQDNLIKENKLVVQF